MPFSIEIFFVPIEVFLHGMARGLFHYETSLIISIRFITKIKVTRTNSFIVKRVPSAVDIYLVVNLKNRFYETVYEGLWLVKKTTVLYNFTQKIK